MTPWNVTIPDEEMDKSLDEKLATQEEADGILSWCVDGALAYRELGLDPPEAVRRATAGYREDQDALAAWIEECCLVGPGYEATVAALRTSYEDWCHANGEKPLGPKVMGKQLKAKGFDYSGEKNPRTRTGIGLRSTT